MTDYRPRTHIDDPEKLRICCERKANANELAVELLTQTGFLMGKKQDRKFIASISIVLRHWISCADMNDFYTGGSPICFKQQDRVAAFLDIDPRTVRRVEKLLSDRFGGLHLIDKETEANGHRNGYTRAGINLKRLVDQAPELLAKIRQERKRRLDEEALFKRITGDIKKLKWTIKDLMDNLPVSLNDIRNSIRQKILDRVRRYTRMTIQQAATYREELTRAIQAVNAYLQGDDNALNNITAELTAEVVDETDQQHCDSPVLPQKMSGEEDADVRPYTYNINNILSNTGICLERSRTKQNRELTNGELDQAIPTDMRHYLESGLTLGQTAELRATEIGIPQSLIGKARRALGEHFLFLSIVVIDANTKHPKNPIRNASGVLASFIRRHGTQELHLDRSIKAIAARA